MALTDVKIRSAKHSGEAGNDKHTDGQGFYLAVTPSGGKLWRLDVVSQHVVPIKAQARCGRQVVGG